MRLIAPSDFTTTRWKNGKGVTTELAISEAGTLADFDWRISMATVVEDGPFSDFSGFARCLVLLDGAGVQLRHESVQGQRTTNHLENTLDLAQFDGGSRTTAILTGGPITDFNVMAKIGYWHADVQIVRQRDELILERPLKSFVYSAVGKTRLRPPDPEVEWELPQGHLLQLEAGDYSMLAIKGSGCIVIQIRPLFS